MVDKRLKDVARMMRKIDFAMLMTFAPGGQIGGRPMSNNREVDYNGYSYYFTRGLSQMVRDIERNSQVALAFQGDRRLLGRPGPLINVQGVAKVIRDKAHFAEHWNKELGKWFKEGVDTPGLVMIRVQARRVNYWNGRHDGEILLGA